MSSSSVEVMEGRNEALLDEDGDAIYGVFFLVCGARVLYTTEIRESRKYKVPTYRVDNNAVRNSSAKMYLQSSDNEKFAVSKAACEQSTLLKNILEDIQEAHQDMPIPLPNVSSPILKKVRCVYLLVDTLLCHNNSYVSLVLKIIEYCEYHKHDDNKGRDKGEGKGNDKGEDKGEDKDEGEGLLVMDLWDTKFLDVDKDTLFEIITVTQIVLTFFSERL